MEGYLSLLTNDGPDAKVKNHLKHILLLLSCWCSCIKRKLQPKNKTLTLFIQNQSYFLPHTEISFLMFHDIKFIKMSMKSFEFIMRLHQKDNCKKSYLISHMPEKGNHRKLKQLPMIEHKVAFKIFHSH